MYWLSWDFSCSILLWFLFGETRANMGGGTGVALRNPGDSRIKDEFKTQKDVWFLHKTAPTESSQSS